MTLLRRTHTRDKTEIMRAFDPFANPGAYAGMVIGNDLDSVLSACFLKQKFGWDVSAVYDYKNLWVGEQRELFLEKFNSGKLIAIDLDVYYAKVFSLGHHILEHRESDSLPGHARTLNPNFIRGINVADFKRKYPLGTIHFLLWLLGCHPLSRECLLTVWLADSSFINAQSHRFAKNVREWVENFLDLDLFKQMLGEVDTKEFEEELSAGVLQSLKGSDLCGATGQVTSRHLQLSGYQCQWMDPNRQNEAIQKLFGAVSGLTGWQAPTFPSQFEVIQGQRGKRSLDDLLRDHGSLDTFLKSERVFSYVFPYNDSVNYTHQFS